MPPVSRGKLNPLSPPSMSTESSLKYGGAAAEPPETASQYSLGFKIDNPWGRQLLQLLSDNASAFARDSHDIGCTSLVCHRIVTDGPPILGYNYKPPQHLRSYIQGEISWMLNRCSQKE